MKLKRDLQKTLTGEDLLTKRISETIENIKYIHNRFDGAVCVGWSGGKDSTVVLDLCVRLYGNDIPVVFCDTRIEFPETYEFIEKMRKFYNLKNFHVTKPVRSFFEDLNARKGGLWSMAKWRPCCNNLKKIPLLNWMEEHGIKISISGTRKEESVKRRTYSLISEVSMGKRKILFGNPILDWSEEDVWNYHRRYNLPYNRIYDMGYDRCGCWACPCPNKAIDHYSILAKNHPKFYKIISNPKWRGKDKDKFYRHVWIELEE